MTLCFDGQIAAVSLQKYTSYIHFMLICDWTLKLEGIYPIMKEGRQVQKKGSTQAKNGKGTRCEFQSGKGKRWIRSRPFIFCFQAEFL